jgi:hypothetical protein
MIALSKPLRRPGDAEYDSLSFKKRLASLFLQCEEYFNNSVNLSV